MRGAGMRTRERALLPRESPPLLCGSCDRPCDAAGAKTALCACVAHSEPRDRMPRCWSARRCCKESAVSAAAAAGAEPPRALILKLVALLKLRETNRLNFLRLNFRVGPALVTEERLTLAAADDDVIVVLLLALQRRRQ